MGFMRKALFLGTGGLSGMAGVKANSKKERTAKAAEQQVRLQRQALRGGQRPVASVPSGFVKAKTKFRVSCPHCQTHFFAPIGESIGCPKCGERIDVQRGDGALIRRVRAVTPAPSVLDSRGRIISKDH
jgi:hypothetical protein